MSHFSKEIVTGSNSCSITPDNYEAELVPQAIGLVVGIIKVHPQINMHLKGVDALHLAELNRCGDIDKFKNIVRNIFNEHTYHVVQRADNDLDGYLKVLHGQDDRTLGEIFEDIPEVVLQVLDIRNTAKTLLVQWKNELEISRLDDGQPVLSASPIT